MTPGVIRNGAKGSDIPPSSSEDGNDDTCGVQSITLDRSALLSGNVDGAVMLYVAREALARVAATVSVPQGRCSAQL